MHFCKQYCMIITDDNPFSQASDSLWPGDAVMGERYVSIASARAFLSDGTKPFS